MAGISDALDGERKNVNNFYVFSVSFALNLILNG